ncbi:MAG: protein kinase domain-containing protein, partial [Thermoanaerobaculia bacterium]
MSYRVLRQLAGGGFSEIFEVEDPASALPERLILKRLTAEMSARPDVQEAFSEEAKILRELKHPNIVTFRRCYFDDKRRICLLMEKVAGEPLDAWARRHASRPELVLDLF